MSKPVLVSACLLGRACRYDGASKTQSKVVAWAAALRESGVEVIAVCPEELGGLGTPRPAAQLSGGDGHAVLSGTAAARVVGTEQDVTAAFVEGAWRAARAAPQCEQAVLKARSPSCGVGVTSIDGAKQAGDGVFAALLRERGVRLRSDEDL